MKKKRETSDIDLMIEVLEEAKSRSVGIDPSAGRRRSFQELCIIMDLIDEGMVRGENEFLPNALKVPVAASLQGINLKGRRLLQELKDYKYDRGFWTGASKTFWLVLGSVLSLSATLLAAYLKVRWHLP